MLHHRGSMTRKDSEKKNRKIESFKILSQSGNCRLIYSKFLNNLFFKDLNILKFFERNILDDFSTRKTS